MSARGRASRRGEEQAAKRAEAARLASDVRERFHANASALTTAPGKLAPSTFCHLYSSRDDALSVFEDAAGHVVAVGTARLA